MLSALRFNLARYTIKPLVKGELSKKISVPREVLLVPDEVPVGTLVEITGLQNTQALNGRFAKVIR